MSEEQPADSETLDSETLGSEPASERDRPLPALKLTGRDIARRLLIAVVIVGAVAGLYFTGRAATTGLDAASESLLSAVDRLIPASGDEVLRQSQVGIDVANGHDAYLIVNGVEIRSAKDGLIKDLGTGQVLVQPGPGKAIESLNEGRNCVVAMVWETLKTEATASPVSWCFDAT
ncbi:MAG TPA: hypothetical protein VL068_05595 [Microthrixaceae bacterium]|nr:hypothetical protein [Microthrixaceae bacterium]